MVSPLRGKLEFLINKIKKLLHIAGLICYYKKVD